MSVEDFQRHWRTRHAALVVRQSGLRRYIQNHTLLSAYDRSEPSYDGVAEAWFDDTDSMRALSSSPEYLTRLNKRFFCGLSKVVLLSANAYLGFFVFFN